MAGVFEKNGYGVALSLAAACWRLPAVACALLSCLCCQYVAALPWAAVVSKSAGVHFRPKAPPPVGGWRSVCAALLLPYISTGGHRLQAFYGVFINFDVLHNASRLLLLDLHKKRCVAF